MLEFRSDDVSKLMEQSFMLQVLSLGNERNSINTSLRYNEMVDIEKLREPI
jgi:tRNA threonylcarbamoyladenosine modification (KEOPS) complex  Pcc1 subunit